MTKFTFDPKDTDDNSVETPTATEDQEKGGSMGEESSTDDSDLGSEEVGQDQ